MPGKPPTDILQQAQGVLAAWNQIDAKVAFGTLTNAALTADITQANLLASQMNTLEAQITNLRNQRDTLQTELWDKVKRVRNGVKANYGDDSSQYEMVGGTRLSERKSPVRKAKPAA
jgi:uncharacterized alpha-E superfamily protein